MTDEEATFNTSSSCTFLVTVRDNAPRIECPANITRTVDADECGAEVAVDPFVVINNCSDDAVVSDDFNFTGDPSGFYPVGTTVVILTVTDQENPGLSSSCSFVVTVSDNAPGITCPDDVIRAANPEACGADITFDALDVEDNCSDNAAVTNNINSISDPSGFYSVGTTVVILTVTDQTNPGLNSTCSFSVTVNDETPPAIVSCPGNLSIVASTGECEGVAAFPLPEFSDNCGEVSVEGNVDTSDLLPLGLTQVVYVAEDDAGNESECQFTIEVLPADVDAMISGPTEFCPDEPATLTASGGESYLWSTMETGPTIPITSPGTYSVTVTGPSGCTATASQTVTADCGELSANFTANQDTACVGFLANFQDNSTGNITGRLWDFGNGNFSEETNPFAVFPDVGSYTVSLTVSNGASTNTFSQVVEIYPAIETDFSVAFANGCDQREARFTSTTESTYPVDYAWNFGDGTTSSLVNPRHYFATFDTANVDLVVTDRFGCSAQSSMDIFIEDNLATPPTTVVDSILCAGGSVTVGNTVFNEGNPSGEVTLSTAEGCDSLVRVRLRFADAETASLAADAGADRNLCGNVSSLTLRGNLPPGLTGNWQAVDGGVITDASSRATNVNEIPEGASRFVWELSTVACGAFSRDTVTITREAPRPEVADAGPDRGFCNDATEISLRAQASGSDVVLGRWEQSTEQQASGVTIDDIDNPNTTISGAVADQIYTFTWTISTNRCGEFDRDTVRLALSNDALTPARISGEDISCGGVPVLITGNVPEGTTEAIFETLPGENVPTLTMLDADTVLVGDLSPGINTVIYTLSADNCPDYSSDTFRIITTDTVCAKADLFFKQREELITIDVLDNDTIVNREEVDFQLLSRPEVGKLIAGDRPGVFTYMFEKANTEPISFAYRICVRGCPESCRQASVNISRQPALEAPRNVITPNGDHIGNAFIVPNAEDYAGGVALTIFDRWGDVQFEAKNYQNDWTGGDLPVGTYFYLIRAGFEKEFEMTGSVTIIR
ncbi:hypothetical protein A3850_001050 [Lewinella sp. 4G2]|nr:hypothetical protein A3850_001050 [Lewinella sp. 4G2]